MRKITAYLRFDGFEKKVYLAKVVREWREIITLPTSISFLQQAFRPDSPNKHPVFTFEWRRQLTRFTHEYSLKEIDYR